MQSTVLKEESNKKKYRIRKDYDTNVFYIEYKNKSFFSFLTRWNFVDMFYDDINSAISDMRIKIKMDSRKWDSINKYLIKNATYNVKQEIMTITYIDNSIKQFKGSFTSWYEYPMIEKCSVSVDVELMNIKKYFDTHGNPYPTAHVNNGIE